MTYTLTVKEQLLDLRTQLDALIDEEAFMLEEVKVYSASIMRKATEMAEKDTVRAIVDLAEGIMVTNRAVKAYEKDLKKVARQITKLEKEIAKLEKMDVDFETDVVDEFLATWREKAEKFILESKVNYPKQREALVTSEKYRSAHYKEREEMLVSLDAQYGSLFFAVHNASGSSFEEQMDNVLTQEVANKKANLLGRVTELTGKVTEANLYIGQDGNINGYVVGDKGKVTVQTIIAGGYNIQIAHYRLLVHAVK